MSAWLWLLVGFGAVGGLLLLALAVPVHLRLVLTKGGLSESHLRIEWLFGLVRKRVTGTPEQAPQRKRVPADRQGEGPTLRALWRSGLVPRGVSLLRRLRRAVSIRELRVRAAVNAGDPSETGMAFALIGPAVGLLAAVPRTDIYVVPDYGDEVGMRGEVRGWVRVVPIVGLLPILAFALSPATWRGVRMLRKARRT